MTIDLTGNGRTVRLGERTLVMGIVNVTPDSFFDGGRHATVEAAIKHGLRLVEEGADLLDIGGESSRPGSDPVPPDEEMRRIVPVIRELAGAASVPISVDTTKAVVADASLDAGASWVNDISAGTMDSEMLPLMARWDVPFVAMHMRGTPKTMQIDTGYDDLVGEIIQAFEERLTAMEAAGMDLSKVLFDPGIGFGKAPEHNFTLLAQLAAFRVLGCPLLVGPSRKSFLKVVGIEHPDNRLSGSLAAATVCALAGVEVVRVHDVAETVQAVWVADRIRRESLQTPV
ncbi:MAG: dihydropteroate synthase [bacterium]